MATLTGRVAVVTGGGRGIGAATARYLAEAGAAVAVLARTSEEVEQVARQLADQGARSLAVSVDIADPAAVATAFQKVRDVLGPVDVLINNAAIVGPRAAAIRIDPLAWQTALAINLNGAFFCIQEVLPDMVARGWGRIVNVSTPAATGRGMALCSAYTVSKAGLEVLSAHLAAELAASGVTVNVVRARGTDTAMQLELRSGDPAELGAEWIARLHEMYQSGQLQPPEIPARLIARLIEEETTGEIVDVADERAAGLLAETNRV